MNAVQADRGRTRYQPETLVATGGMGEVWRATDTVLHRPVALKLLKPEFAEDATFRERFVAEARHAASLQHPGVAAVFDFGELPAEAAGTGSRAGTRPYLVMELVDGKPLSTLLREGPRLDPEVARDLVSQAAEALGAAHAVGLVHRDVKPANLLVTPDGQVKVTDFGIARAAGGATLTQTGQLVGTPQYLSPEQAEGRGATSASDVYALGVVLFECLTGRRPFTGDTPVATALAHLRQPVPDLPEGVPADLAAITRRALAKDPAERYANAGELAAALRTGVAAPAEETSTRVLTGLTPVVAGAPAASQVLTTPGERSGWRDRLPSRLRSGVRSWWPIALLGALALVLVVTLALAGRSPQPSASSHAATTPPAASAVKVRVRPAAYVGKPVAQVRDALRRLGLQSKVVRRRDNPGGHVAGTVAALAPTGMVAKDSLVRLTVWKAPPPPPATKPAPAPQTKPKPKPPKKPHHAPPGKHKGKGH